MIGHLKDTFPTVPTLALLATVIPNILEYIHKLLQFRAPIWLYKELLDRPYITYFVVQIKKPGFKELNFLMTPVGNSKNYNPYW